LLTLRGQDALQRAEVVAGFQTVLNVVQPWLSQAEVRPMSYRDQEQVLEYVGQQARLGRRCVVCCWGDLNVSAGELLARVRRHAGQVHLIPGISSVQVACARAGISLEDTLFITLHQRRDSADDLTELVRSLQGGQRHIILLPRPWDMMPASIAHHLLEAGLPADRSVTVYQRLTLEGEQEWRGTLAECAALSGDFSDLSIMLFPRPGESRD
jgi:cobalt-precorrin-7 (C5)-methyltransferase